MQSRQKVQSRLPTLRGWKSANSHPPAPRMQSLVRQLAQTDASRTLISRGETSEPKKLNCPTGHTCLQNAAPRKIVSTANATTK